MKLEKIKDVRVGQIWSFDNGKTYNVIIDVSNIDNNFNNIVSKITFELWNNLNYTTEKNKKKEKDFLIFANFCCVEKNKNIDEDLLEKFKEPDKYLIGFLGITHKIEDGRLVEIERKEFEVDDIIYCKKYIAFCHEINFGDYDILEGQIFIINDWDEFSDYIIITLLNENGKEINFKIKDKNKIKKYFCKIGTLGVNYEFINNKMKKYARNNNKN